MMRKLLIAGVLMLAVLAGGGCRRFDVPGTWEPPECTDCPPPTECIGGGRPIGWHPDGRLDCVPWSDLR